MDTSVAVVSSTLHEIQRRKRRGREEEKNGVEMAVHGWPTALCELFLSGAGETVARHVHTDAYTRVKNGNGDYDPVVWDEANGQKGRSEETAYAASAQP